MRVAREIRVVGLVQGVGFRPQVYRLAARLGLAGYVANLGGSEVLIHVEGPPGAVREFEELLRREKPPPAVIEEVYAHSAPPRGYTRFTIMPSRSTVERRSAIPPDLGICEDCMREILDPSNRRYRYPWNSCAWCGPRFSMIRRLPYDRHNTSMSAYPLCSECRREYEDPGDRRFHAQGISCPRCGPRTLLLDGTGRRVASSDPVGEAARLLMEGNIVAVKGLGGYHLAGLASDDSVVERIRRVKARPPQPLAVMARDCEAARKIARVAGEDCEILWSPERPILLLERRTGGPLSRLVAPGLDTVGVMMPYTGLHLLLLHSVEPGILVMTSANKHGLPTCTSLECVLDQLGGEIDYILEHDREIVHRVDDSVVRRTLGRPVILRRARGYAPYWIRVRARLREAVALGAELQTAGAVAFEDKVVLTQYIGDLDSPPALRELEAEVRWLAEQYKLKVEVVALDMHPGYHNRSLIPTLLDTYPEAEIVEVQHHHAHVASLVADAGLDPEGCYPAVAVDGAGYGPDGAVWGGEALVYTGGRVERASHISYYPLPGGDAAARRPARVLAGLLAEALGPDEALVVLEELGAAERGGGRRELETAARTWRVAPRTSSAGRLADALAAMLGVCYERSYEGEPAITLEAHLRSRRATPLTSVEPPMRGSMLDAAGAILWALERAREGEGERAAATVLYWIGHTLAQAALKKCRGPLLLTGGAAVNDYIAQGALEAAREHGVELVTHRRVPPGDGGIALGQALLAAWER